MNRNEEYRALLAEMEGAPLPAALEGCAVKAAAKARRRRRRNLCSTLASLGGAAAAFVLAVNLSLPFAMACRKVPVLKELAAAVALSPCL